MLLLFSKTCQRGLAPVVPVISANLQGCDYSTAIIPTMSSSFQPVQHYPTPVSLKIFYKTSKLAINATVLQQQEQIVAVWWFDELCLRRNLSVGVVVQLVALPFHIWVFWVDSAPDATWASSIPTNYSWHCLARANSSLVRTTNGN
jgi:hypothetical protein